jgi:hypothetical protein
VTVLCVVVQAKLSLRQCGFLLGQGYLVVRSQLAPEVLARVKDRLDGLVRQVVAAGRRISIWLSYPAEMRASKPRGRAHGVVN